MSSPWECRWPRAIELRELRTRRPSATATGTKPREDVFDRGAHLRQKLGRPDHRASGLHQARGCHQIAVAMAKGEMRALAGEGALRPWNVRWPSRGEILP